MDKELREHRSSFIVFSILRILVLAVLVRQIMLASYESAFFCVLTLLLLYVPSWVQVKLRIELPPPLEITILCFIFAAEILGEVNAFYVVVPNWDTMLHTLNGFLAAAVGFSMVILLNDDIMTRLIESYQGEGRVQSWVILGEVLLLFLLVHTRLTRAGRRRLSALALAVLLSVTVLFAQGLDIGIETAKLRVELETITSQSVQKIAQVLQQQVESVLDKGVSVDDLYDIYGWLDDIDATLDMVSRLDFTEEGRIRAVMDEAYLSGRLRSAFGEMAGQYGLLAAACAVSCGPSVFQSP